MICGLDLCPLIGPSPLSNRIQISTDLEGQVTSDGGDMF